MTSTSDHRPTSGVLAFRDFRITFVVRFLSAIARLAQTVAVGWELYARTNDVASLGILGLCSFAPGVLLLLIGGGIADRFERRRVAMICYGCFALLSVLLYIQSLEPSGSAWPIYTITIAISAIQAFLRPALGALLRELVPTEQFGRAVALLQVAYEVGAVIGPAVGGWIYGLGGHPGAVYLTSAAIYLVEALLLMSMEVRPVRANKARMSMTELLAGVVYVWRTKVILGLISLDLFAGFFGGVVALMPVFARDILDVGPIGLGGLRSAPSVGAVLVAVTLTLRPIGRHSGRVMLWCVAIFAAATVVFGMSRNLAVSLGALVVIGASDTISVIIRQTRLPIATPDAVRGRVMAVNELAVNASNDMGELESGLTASWFGAIPAVVFGGLAALATVIVHAVVFPELSKEEDTAQFLEDPLASPNPDVRPAPQRSHEQGLGEGTT